MEIIGVWVALLGYTVAYAGLANWNGQSMSLGQAFTGSSGTGGGPGAVATTPQLATPVSTGGLGAWHG